MPVPDEASGWIISSARFNLSSYQTEGVILSHIRIAKYDPILLFLICFHLRPNVRQNSEFLHFSVGYEFGHSSRILRPLPVYCCPPTGFDDGRASNGDNEYFMRKATARVALVWGALAPLPS
jgi:hypothetical protein